MPDPSDPVVAAGMARARAQGADERAALASPAAERAREASEDKFEDLPDGAAIKLARSEFPDLLTGAPEAIGDLPKRLSDELCVSALATVVDV